MANYVYKDGELMHYGVPGMRWGVRKARPTSSDQRGLFGWKRKQKSKTDDKQAQQKPVKKKKISEMSDDEIKARLARIDLENQYREAIGKKPVKQTKPLPENTSKKKKLSEVSDDELRNRVARLELEKRYKELSKAVNPPKSTRGRDFTLRVLEKIGENVLTDIGTQAGATGLGELINKIAGVASDDNAHRIVNPRKNQTNKK